MVRSQPRKEVAYCWISSDSFRCHDIVVKPWRHKTRRFAPQYLKVGQALNTSTSEISKDFLHESVRGILLAETPGLTSSNFAAVTTGAEDESNGTSLQFSDFVDAFNTQWRDAALAARDAKGRKTEAVVAVVAVVDNFDLSGLRKPRCALNLHFPEMMLINKTMMTSWKNQQTQGCRMRAQSFLTSLMATWQTLMHPHLKLCVSKSEFSRSTRASVSCQGCPRLPSVLLLLALALLTAWLSHPLVANLQSLEARARSARGRDTILRTRDHSLQTLVRWSLAKNTDLALGSLSTNVQEASDRNWHNSRWITSRSSASSWSLHTVSPSWATCIRMRQRE